MFAARIVLFLTGTLTVGQITRNRSDHDEQAEKIEVLLCVIAIDNDADDAADRSCSNAVEKCEAAEVHHLGLTF